MPRPIPTLALLACLAASPADTSRAEDAPAAPAAPSVPPTAPPAPATPPAAAPASSPAPVLPDPAKAGEAKAITFDFEGQAADAPLPAGFLSVDGHWRILADTGPTANAILRQDLHVAEYAVVLATGEGRAYADGKASVRFRPESGDEDASGGIVFRARDAENYGLVRANAIEGNFRLYTVRNGFRRQIASLDIEAPKLKEWHRIEVSFVGNTFVATLDGGDRIEAVNDTLKAGWCGLWTKSDSVTSFDDFRIEPVASKAGGQPDPKVDAKPTPTPEPVKPDAPTPGPHPAK
jgi:hypothetical protein